MRFGMVIDLQRCVGCSACALACKAENNTRDRNDDQSFNWADFLIETKGTFPNVTHDVIPVLCNHCSDAPCVKICPTTPKAMYKTPEGITLHDPKLCIGCGRCQTACPYSTDELNAATSNAGATYSVISYNQPEESTQPRWADKSAMIPGCTASAAETAAKSGVPVPAMNMYVSSDVTPIRKDGVIEKCTFCAHRTLNGMQPACVEVCPSKARIFGDQDDPKSQISQILAKEKSFRLQEDKGTKPNVHYIGKYSTRA